MTANTAAIDHAHMARALQLAARGTYSTAPNPAVGCVLLDAHGAVVGEGWHHRAGQPHAEVYALHAAAMRARGGTAYVTLEPCSHHGRTPPCADALIEAGVRRVVAAMQDPNPRVAGDGLRKLDAAGIVTAVGLLEREARELNRGFVSRMTRGRPWVTVKLGSSADGRTALADGSQPVDHVGARTRRRAAPAGARLGDRHRDRHGTRGRSLPDRTRSGPSTWAVAYRCAWCSIPADDSNPI